MEKNTDYEVWRNSLGKGVRNKSLLNLMWVQLKLYEQYSNEMEEDKSLKGMRFSTFLNNVAKIKDVQTLLNCSERTARDYLKTLIYFQLTNKVKLQVHQTHVNLANSGEKD